MKKKVSSTNNKLASVDLVSIGKASEDAILDGADYLNSHRALANVIDGNKPSYRRLIWSALQFPKGELQPSVKIINGMASYHPHSLDGITGLNAVFVKSGVFKGSGSFGKTSILGEKGEPAAPRYTKSALSDLYYDIVRPLIQCVPLVDSPVGPKELQYIPLPVPLCLMCKSLVSGIGFGISTVYPNFSPMSMYRALVEDNPNLLEPNVDLLLDKKNSELARLWNTGKGKIIYSYKLQAYTNEDGKQGFIFTGSTDIFTPNFRKLGKYIDKGDVFVEDMTTKDGPKLMVGLVSNRSSLSLKELETLCRQSCFDSTVYNLNVTDGKTCFRIPLKDWLSYVYGNYIKLLDEVNKKNIEKANFDIAVQKALPIISDILLNKNPKITDKELVNLTGFPEEVVQAVMGKPISYLRNDKSNVERIKQLSDKLKELLKFNSKIYAENVIKRL